MSAFAITFGSGPTLRYLRANYVEATHEQGYRPVVWTRDRMVCEKFASEKDAREYAEANLPHQAWGVSALPMIGRPGGDDNGGTPVMMAA